MAAPADDQQIPVVRKAVRAWLEANWAPGRPRRDWQARVLDAGWAGPSWPAGWYGRGCSPASSRAVREEFARVGAEGTGHNVFNLWANTLLAVAGDELKRRFVPPLVLGDVDVCLLYSEPGAGSDLAGLRTRAERDGDSWVVNGQKVWSSGAHVAHYGFLVARTDWDVPKHRGITFFLFPMRQEGVEVRPIKQITGSADFNEVFFTDARVSDDHRVGDLNAGWKVLQVALGFERMLMGGAVATAAAGSAPAAKGGTTRPAPGLVPAVDLVALAREKGLEDDPLARQELARMHTLRAVNQWNTRRAATDAAQGRSSPLASLGKLAMSRIEHETGRVRSWLCGAEAMVDAPSSKRGGGAGFSLLNAYFTSIGGGTDQIQRNIIAERILGLPREAAVDRDVPLRDVRRAVGPGAVEH